MKSKLLAAQLDDYISDLENLLVGLSRAVSTNPADTAKNNALLLQIKTKLPAFIANIRVFSLDGSNVGTSAGPTDQAYASDREFFREILAGRRASFAEIFRTHGAEEWVLAIGYPVEDQEGELRGVIAVGTRLKLIQDAFRTQALPPGSIVRVVDQHGMVVAESQKGPDWIGRDLSGLGLRHPAHGGQGGERDRILARSHPPHHRLFDCPPSSLAGLGRAADGCRLRHAGLAPALGRRARHRRAPRGLRHRLDVLGPHRAAAAATGEGCVGARRRRAQPSQRSAHPRRGRQSGRHLQPDGEVAGAAAGRGAEVQRHAFRRHRRFTRGDRLLRPGSPDHAVEPRRRAALRLHRRADAGHADQDRAAGGPRAIAGALRAGAQRRKHPRRRGQAPAPGRLLGRRAPRRRPDVPPRRQRARRRLGARGHHRPQAGRGAAPAPRPLRSAHRPAEPVVAAEGAGRAAVDRAREPDVDRAVRSRRLQGRERHARPLDRRPIADRGRAAPDRTRPNARASSSRYSGSAATSSW